MIYGKFFMTLDVYPGHTGYRGYASDFLIRPYANFAYLELDWNSLQPVGYVFDLSSSVEGSSNSGGQRWIGVVYRADQKSLTSVYCDSPAGAIPNEGELKPLGVVKELTNNVESFSAYLGLYNNDQNLWDLFNLGTSTLKNYGSFSVDRFMHIPNAIRLSPSVLERTFPAKWASISIKNSPRRKIPHPTGAPICRPGWSSIPLLVFFPESHGKRARSLFL